MTNPRIKAAATLLKQTCSFDHQKRRIVDIGARDCGLKSLVLENFEYLSIDLFQNADNTIDIVGDAFLLDYNFINSKSDIIVGLDVLEHIDDIHEILNKLLCLNVETYFFCLPSTSHWLYRMKYLLNGRPPGGKYNIYSTASVKDRHRWLTPYCESLKMMKSFSELYNYSLTSVPLNNKFTETFLAHRYPEFLSWATFFILRKKSIN